MYPIKNSVKIKNRDYNWPFIDIFIYETRNNLIYLNYDKKQLDIKEEFVYDYINSHNNKNKYKIQIFKDYQSVLNKLYKNWKTNCLTSEWNHRVEKGIINTYEFDCINIIPGYDKQIVSKHIFIKKFNTILFLLEYLYYIIFFILSIIILIKNRQ